MTTTPTRSKSKTLSAAEAVTMAEQAALAKAAATQTEATEAEQELRDRRQEQQGALEALEAITEALAAGSGAVAQTELIDARNTLEFATLTLTGAERRASSLTRVRTVTTHDVADALKPAIEAMLPGVPVYSTFVTPPAITEADAPVAFLVQSEPSGNTRYGLTGGGAVSATVHLHYFSTAIHRPLERDTLERVLTEAGIKLDGFPHVATRDTGDGLLQGTARLKPRAIVPPIPTVTPNAVGLNMFATNLAGKLAKTNATHRKVMRQTAEIASNTTDESGVRTSTVVVRVNTGWHSEGSFSTGQAKVVGTPESVAAGEVGTFCEGMGRITSARLDSSRVTESGGEFVLSIEFISYAA
jgi:hypothetical protein